MKTFKQFLIEAPDKNIPSRSHADAVMAKRVAEKIADMMMAHWYNPISGPHEWFDDEQTADWVEKVVTDDSATEQRLKQAVLVSLQERLASS